MKRPLLMVSLLSLVLGTGTASRAQNAAALSQPAASADLAAKTAGWLAQVSTGFAENKGQLYDQHDQPNPAVKYLLHLPGLNVQLRATGFSYDAWTEKPSEGKAPFPCRIYHRVDIELEGANPYARLVAENPVAGSATTVINDRGVFSNILEYGKVTYKEIYPGIDLEFVAKKGAEKPVEYNFIIHPGANAAQIKMRYRNGSDINLKNGEIEMKLAFGILKEKIPRSYTKQDGQSRAVQYLPLDEAQDLYAFNIPNYDRSQTLVIDPTPSLVWATYYGGAPTVDHGFRSSDHPTGLAVDPNGNVLMSGYTQNQMGLATTGAYLDTGDLANTFTTGDGYCVKFSPSGARLWSTYIGTNNALATTNAEYYPQVGTDAAGNVFLTMLTTSQAPTTAGVHNPTRQSLGDPYLMKLNPSGSSLLWATYIGVNVTSANSGGRTIALHVLPSGDVLVGGFVNTGSASSLLGFGTGYLQTRPGGDDAYLVKINGSNGTGIWGTYFGGPGVDIIRAIAHDASGNIYISGYTTSTSGIATAGAFQTAYGGGGSDMFLAKLNSNGSGVQWSTYYGGSGVDAANSLAVNSQGNPVIGGTSSSSGLATVGTYQQATGSALVAQFSASGSRIWATYYLNSQTNTITSSFTGALQHVAVDEQDNIYISGLANAAGNASTPCSYQPAAVDNDPYITKFDSSGQRLWGTYYGSTGTEGYNNIFPGYYQSGFAYGGNGDVYLAVASEAGGGQATAGAFQTTTGSVWEGLLAKFNEGGIPGDLTVSASSITPDTQTACILGVPGLISGNIVTYTTSGSYTSPVFYQWQSADGPTGPWTDMPGEVFQNLQPPSSQTTKYYRRLVQLTNNGCNKTTMDSSVVATVSISTDAAPLANADGPQWYVCSAPGDTATLNGSATGGTAPYTYEWFAGSSSTAAAMTASYTPAAPDATTYTLRVTDANGCVDLDQATLVPAAADAGPDKSICQGSGGIQLGTAPVASPSITYSWSILSGTASSLSCVTCAQPLANPTDTTVYVLTLTVNQKGGGTCSSTDTVQVIPVAAPNGVLNFAGSDTTLCRGTTDTLGGASADVGYVYTWSPGQYLSSATVFNPIFDGGSNPPFCGVTYTVTATKSGCAFTDYVQVNVVDPSITFQNQSICGPVWIRQATNTGNCTAATYSWSVVSGPGTIQQTADNGASAYLYSPGGNTVFRRTTALNGDSCTADVTVGTCGGGTSCLFDIVTDANQGCPKIFGPGGSFVLRTTLADTTSYNFSWSPASMVDNPTAPSVTVSSGAHAIIICTITNKFIPGLSCTDSLEVNNPAWAQPSASAPDTIICGSTATQIGTTATGGYTYHWEPSLGLSSDTVSNPIATLTNNTTYLLTITEPSTGCAFTDTVHVNVSAVQADAGNDRTVCNGGTVTLGTAPPAGSSYTYSWQPTGAAWANGTGPTDAQPQVLFASSSQAFTLTVTDPASGCSLHDTVTLSSTITVGEYAGTPPDSVCPGASVQLGRTAEPLALYNWTLADGSSATGFSCTTCANPTLTAPDTTTTYKVQVSYPGCSQPMEDSVTVVVKNAPGFDLTDQNYCPSTPLAIGFGATGNPAAPANVSAYLWTPSTGLSSASVDSPTTNITIPTGYAVKVTYDNGCVRTDSVHVTPIAIADGGPNQTLCLGASVIVGTPALASTTYSWSGGPIVGSSTIAQPTVNPTATTTYTVSVTANSCTVADTVMVTVDTPDSFTLDGITSICQGGMTTIGITDTPSVYSIWQWVPSTGVASPTSPITSITATDTTTYRLIQTNTATGCSNYQDVVVVVRPNPLSIVAADTSLCVNSTVTLPLTVTPAGTYQYVWTPPTDLSSAYVQNPSVTTSNPATYSVIVTDTVSQCQAFDTVNVSIKPAAACYPPVGLTGRIFHDANGLKNLLVDSSSSLALPASLYVSLLDSTGTVINTVAVAADGSFDFGITPAGKYSIVLHQTPTGSATPAPPANWKYMGENLGTGFGSDAAINGILTGITVLASDVADADFGIQQPPVSDPKSYTIDQPVPNQIIPLDGTFVTTGPGTISPDQLTGSDPEDGLFSGSVSNRTLVISAGPTNGELWYNGALVMAGQKIVNYNPALLSFKTTGGGYLSTTFQYAYVDSAGIESAPAAYTIQWSIPLPTNLASFTAGKAGPAALLQWQTTNKQNCAYFSVQRSVDGNQWKSIGRRDAIGSSSHYQLTDVQPLDGPNYYRLSIVAKDGSYQLSGTRRLDFGGSIGTITLVPNPARGKTTVVFSQPTETQLRLKVRNNLDQLIGSYEIPAGTQRFELNLGDQVAGIYFIGIEAAGAEQHLKLIVQ